MKCSATRRVIDQADDPTGLPYQTAAHLEACSSCRQFASEREQLRKLLLEPHRVSAPANFDAMVARRLAERGSSRPFRLAIGFYLRAAGAAVALACLVLVIQTARLKPISSTAPPSREAASDNTAVAETNPGNTKNTVAANGESIGTPTGVVTVKGIPRVHPAKRVGGLVNRESTLATSGSMTAQPRALILVRSPGSEQEIAVPMVSVGATPWVPVSIRPQEEHGFRIAF